MFFSVGVLFQSRLIGDCSALHIQRTTKIGAQAPARCRGAPLTVKIPGTRVGRGVGYLLCINTGHIDLFSATRIYSTRCTRSSNTISVSSVGLLQGLLGLGRLWHPYPRIYIFVTRRDCLMRPGRLYFFENCFVRSLNPHNPSLRERKP